MDSKPNHPTEESQADEKSEVIDSSQGEQMLACAELIHEEKGSLPNIRPEKVEEIKRRLRYEARRMHQPPAAAAMLWLTFHVGENLRRFHRACGQMLDRTKPPV